MNDDYTTDELERRLVLVKGIAAGLRTVVEMEAEIAEQSAANLERQALLTGQIATNLERRAKLTRRIATNLKTIEKLKRRLCLDVLEQMAGAVVRDLKVIEEKQNNLDELEQQTGNIVSNLKIIDDDNNMKAIEESA